jgi:hypothetical protein
LPNKNSSLRRSFAKRISKTKQIEATKALEKQLKEERKQADTVILSQIRLTVGTKRDSQSEKRSKRGKRKIRTDENQG